MGAIREKLSLVPGSNDPKKNLEACSLCIAYSILSSWLRCHLGDLPLKSGIFCPPLKSEVFGQQVALVQLKDKCEDAYVGTL